MIAEDPRLIPAIGDEFIYRDGNARKFRWSFTRSFAVFALKDGRILNIVRDATAQTSLWELYERDGRLLTRERVRRAYKPFALTRDGDVLAAYEDLDTGEHFATRLRVAVR